MKLTTDLTRREQFTLAALQAVATTWRESWGQPEPVELAADAVALADELLKRLDADHQAEPDQTVEEPVTDAAEVAGEVSDA